MNEKTLKALVEFVNNVASLSMEGECPECCGNGLESNLDCDDHYGFEFQCPNDVVYSLYQVIEDAREIVKTLETS